MDSPGKRLKFVRESMGLSREPFCELVGLGYIRLSNVESDKARMYVDDLAEVAGAIPQVLEFIVFGRDIDVESCLQSDNPHIQRLGKNLKNVAILPPQ